MKNGFFLVFVLFLFQTLSAQERLVGLSFNPVIAQKAQELKKLNTKSTDTLKVSLPFIEDFSNYTGYPNPNLFLDKLAFINTNYPLFAPTLGAATLDALDASGNLYPQASTRTFPADTLTSQLIRLDSVFSPTTRKINPVDSVYMSFYYQPGGGTGQPWERTGQTPGQADSLVLEFYSVLDSSWHSVWGTEGFPLDSLLNNGKGYFDYVLIPITDTAFFNSHFQFRFRNYCTLEKASKAGFAGNAAQWHIDYIRIDLNRNVSDLYYQDIAFVNPAPSMLKQYQAMPARQFRKEELKDTLSMTMTNLFNETLISYYSYTVLDSSKNVVGTYPEVASNIDPFLPNHTYQTNPMHANPKVIYDFPGLNINQKNSYTIQHVQRQGIGSDLRTANDTTIFDQIFWNYYAYDDGSAENGYGLESKLPGGKIALRFSPTATDTLTCVAIYFNSTKDSGNYAPFRLVVWDNLNGSPNKELYRSKSELYPQFNGLNTFARYILDSPLLVKDTFYIGIEQSTTGFINLGFDRNTSAVGNMFYKTDNLWYAGFFTGSLMMRPYFGQDGLLGVEKASKTQALEFVVYPNPVSHGKIRIQYNESQIKPNACRIRIYDLQGRLAHQTPFQQEIDVNHLSSGIYLLRIDNLQTGDFHTTKLIIR